MNGMERSRVWKNLKQRLGLKGMGCCGAIWSFNTQTITINIEHEEEGEEEEGEGEETHLQNRHHQVIPHVETAAASAAPGMMNLAMALEAERNFRGGASGGPAGRGGRCSAVGPNNKDAGAVKTLMMLIQETEGGDWVKRKKEDEVGGNDWMCCVCMERNKGAAFIPCGHTFCRVCSKELWLNRESCPVCNRSILQILDIF